MHVIRDRIIEDATVELDGGHWENCTFRRCRLVYMGGEILWGKNVVEDSCDLALAGAASVGHILAQTIKPAQTEQVGPYTTAAGLESTR